MGIFAEDAQGIENLNAGAAAYQAGDFAMAVMLYRKAAAVGNVIAMSNLGYCYYYGHSIPVDKQRARRCWEQAAIFGDIAAIYKLGDMYRFGDMKTNLDYSRALYERAFELALDSDNIYVCPDAILRMLQYYPEALDEAGFDRQVLAQYCVEGIQARIADGDHFSERVLQKAEKILAELSGEDEGRPMA